MPIGATNYPGSLDTPSTLVEATNNATGNLANSLDSSSTTSFTLTSGGSVFPNSGIVKIDNELIAYESRAGEVFSTLTRAYEGTTAASHNASATVTLVISAASNNVKSSAIIALEQKLGIGVANAADSASGSVMMSVGGGVTDWRSLSNISWTGYTTSSSGTLQLDATTSTYYQFFTGSSNRTVRLPLAGSMSLGQGYEFHNKSTGTLTITLQGSGGATVTTVAPGNVVLITCLSQTNNTTASFAICITGFTSTLPTANGGTGQTSYTDGELLIGNTSTSSLSKATLTAGSNITITNAGGSITIASTASGGGTKTYHTFTARDNQPPASNFAIFDTRNSVALLSFSAGSPTRSAIFMGVIPEAAVLTSGLIVQLSWTSATATTGNVIWGVQFEKMDTNIDSDSFATATESTTSAPTTAGVPKITAITATTIDSLAAGDFFRLKVYRKSADAGDTMTDAAQLLTVELRGV
jgi:hypothetical protein